MDKNINENAGNNNEENKEETSKDKKLFTAEEVNQIVKRRLNRVNEKHETEEAEDAEHESEVAERAKAVTDREQAITDKENYLACKEFCMTAYYPLELLDILDTKNPDKFRETVEAIGKIGGDPFNRSMPMGSTEQPIGEPMDAFKTSIPHKPRNRFYGYGDN